MIASWWVVCFTHYEHAFPSSWQHDFHLWFWWWKKSAKRSSQMTTNTMNPWSSMISYIAEWEIINFLISCCKYLTYNAVDEWIISDEQVLRNKIWRQQQNDCRWRRMACKLAITSKHEPQRQHVIRKLAIIHCLIYNQNHCVRMLLDWVWESVEHEVSVHQQQVWLNSVPTSHPNWKWAGPPYSNSWHRKTCPSDSEVLFIT